MKDTVSIEGRDYSLLVTVDSSLDVDVYAVPVDEFRRYNLRKSRVAMYEDLPEDVQDKINAEGYIKLNVASAVTL